MYCISNKLQTIVFALRVRFGRLVSARRPLVLCISNFQSRKPKIADYENMNLVRKAKGAKILKPFSPQWIFHEFGAQD